MTVCVMCQRSGNLVCFRCSNRILRWLRELEEWIPTMPLERRAAGIREYQRPTFGSRSPANDAAIAHTDPRTEWDDEGPGAVAVVASWAALVREERAMPPNASGFMVDVDLLRTRHEWITRQPWVDDYVAELRHVNLSVRALVGDPVPRSVGRCISVDRRGDDCGGNVYELDDASGVQCSTCRRIYTGLDLDRLRVAQETG